MADTEDELIERMCAAFVNNDEDLILGSRVGAWPDHPGDDGKRGDAYIYLIEERDQESIRTMMRHVLSEVRRPVIPVAVPPAGGWTLPVTKVPDNA